MALPTEIWLNSRRRRLALLSRCVVVVAIITGSQVRLEPVRWWSSPRVASAIRITPQQAIKIEQLYEDSLPAWRIAGEDVAELTGRIARLIRVGEYDGGELLHLTGELVQARSVQCDLHRQILERTARRLWPHQRARLAGLVAGQRVRE